MSTKKIGCSIFLLAFTWILFAQESFTDVITNQYGKPIDGVLVKVRGSNQYVVSGIDGSFTIQVKIGDVITLTKNGKRINQFVYKGNIEYEMEDESERIDAVYSKSKKNTSKFTNYLDSAKYYQHSNLDKSFDYIEKSLQVTKNKTNIAKAYVVLADNYASLNQYDLALTNYLVAYEKLKKDISLELKIAKSYYETLNYNKSFSFYTKVKQSKSASKNQKIIALEGLGDIAQKQKQNQLALFNYKAGLAIAEEHLITPKITLLNTKIAKVASLIGDTKQTALYLKNSLVSAKKENKKRAIVQADKAAGIYQQSNNYSEEIKLRKSNLKELENAEMEEIIISPTEKVSKQKVKYDIGKAYVNQNNVSQGINYLEESVKDANRLNDIETEKEAVQSLSEVYANLGNDNKALFYYKKYTKLVDALYQKKEEEIKNAVQVNKDLIQKQNRILSLEKDRELVDSKLQLFQTEQNLVNESDKRKTTIIYSLLTGLILLIVSLFYMFRSNKQKKIANNLLALKSLRSQMNPHFIFNALNSVNQFIAQNDERTANRYLTNFSTLMRSVLDNSELDFIPLTKEIEQLKLYLDLEHTRFKDTFDYKINIDKTITLEQFEIPPMLIQPYVENAVWHGLRYLQNKGLLEVNINYKDKESIQIDIIDNGIGREKSKQLKSVNQLKNKSTGMRNIQERINILNEIYHDKAAVSISDLKQDKTGTKVVLTLKKN